MNEKKENFLLLPYIMDILSRKPDYSTSLFKLYQKIGDMVSDKDMKGFGFDSVESAVDFSLGAGEQLGVLVIEYDKECQQTQQILEDCVATKDRKLSQAESTCVRFDIKKPKKSRKHCASSKPVTSAPKLSVMQARKFQKKRPGMRPSEDYCKICHRRANRRIVKK